MNNDVEIRPRQVLEFLLERLNKETGTNFRGASFSTQIMIFKHDKEQALKEFQQYFNNNFNSIISKYFVGYIKTKRICNKCNTGYYSFNIHPFIEFDIEMAKIPSEAPMNLLENWFKAQNNQKRVLSVEHKINIPMLLNLQNKIEIAKSYNKYNLVGMVKRIVDDRQQENFIAIYYDSKNKNWKLSDKDQVSVISNPLEHKQGLVVLLFYSGIINFGQ